ncbi:MAG: helix-turn-helix transcriptional regulator [Chitinivibrionales bacterium]|nr:helix-turn-helix transcriptional regulator [Chitinivibrionales bacterium]
MKKVNLGPTKGKKHSEVLCSDFGQRLFRTRKSRGLSQTELGKRVGLSKRMISHYEGNAQEGPPLTTLSNIADALGVTVSYLLGESTQKALKSEVSPHLLKHVRVLEQLSHKEQKTILNMIEIAASKNKGDKSHGVSLLPVRLA